MKFENLKFVLLIGTILIIIVIICQMQNIKETFANIKCLQNGYKLAFPDKINSSGILNGNIDNQFISYDGLNDGRLTPLTMDIDTKNMLNYILSNILNQINKKTKNKYFLSKIDSVNINTIKQGSVSLITEDRVIKKRITVDFFAHELNKLETRRFIVIFTIDPERNVNIEHINLSNAYKNDNNSKCINNIINNDTLIHTDEALLTYNNICGIDQTKNDYVLLTDSEKNTNKNHGFINSSEAGKHLFLPNIFHDFGELNSQGLYPNRKHNGWWDSNGIALVEDPNCNIEKGEIKTGLDHGIGDRPYQPYDNPTIARSKHNSYENKHHDIFNLAKGNFLGGNLSI
jgi:hypothetical protein